MNRETYAGTAMELLRFSIPMILGAVFQQMFSWADALIVGNFAGEQALAAIGTTNSCYNLLLDLILGASAGLTVLAARYYGAGNRERLHRLSVTYVRLAGACSVLLAVAGILFAGKLMTLLETPAEILSDTVLYLRWLYGGLVFLGLYN
ncbi:MAG: MATE family efflux transporter, partial [Solobacterium sp.]|nr:MATE family efflux transporter [Solobacterium sp.]